MKKLMFLLLVIPILTSCNNSCGYNVTMEGRKMHTYFVFSMLTPTTSVELPKSTEAVISEEIITHITIPESGEYFLEGNSSPISQSELNDSLVNRLSGKVDVRVKISADENVLWGKVFFVMELCRSNGWKPIIAFAK